MNTKNNKMKLKLLIVMIGFFQVLVSQTQVCAQSPYELSWPGEGIIFGTALATGIIGEVLILNVVPLTTEEINLLSREDVNAFDRPATYNYSETASNVSDVGALVCSTLPLTLFISSKVRSDFVTFGVMYLQVMGFSTALPQLSKGSFKRTRPFVYNEIVPLEEKGTVQARLAFFSGHTTHAFALAVFFATTYGDYFSDSKLKPFVWGGSLALASVVGYSRIAAGKHYRTDILVGAAVGSVIGYFIPKLHRISKDRGFSVYPVYGEQQIQLNLNYRF